MTPNPGWADPGAWTEYAARDETRREHALELQGIFATGRLRSPNTAGFAVIQLGLEPD